MNYLAFDTSAEYLSVVALVNGKYETAFFPDSGVRHSEMLMPAVDDVLKKLGSSVEDIDVFCTVTGPGSFTGIRIGVATAKGLADATGKKILGVTSFDTLAYNVKCGKVLAVIDANHGNYYVCGYDDGAIEYPAKFVDNEVIEGLIGEYEPISHKVIEKIGSKKVDPLTGLIVAVEDNLQNASSIVNSVSPFYLRLSQAEEGRK